MKDLNTQEVIGVLVINIPAVYLLSEQEKPSDDIARDLYIVANNSIIAHTGILDEDLSVFKGNFDKVLGYSIDRIEYSHEEFLVSSFWLDELDWHIVSVISLDQPGGITNQYGIATMIIMMINLFFVFVGITLFSGLFVRPVKRMITTIRTKGEKLEFINLKTTIYELSQLEQEYNGMITRIKLLINNKVDKQKILRNKDIR